MKTRNFNNREHGRSYSAKHPVFNCLQLMSWTIVAIAVLQEPVSSFSCRTSTRLSRREVFASGFVVLLPSATAQARNLPESTGADLSLSGSVSALVTIIALRQSLSSVLSSSDNLKSLNTVLTENNVPKDETGFKRLFDTYSDIIPYKQRFVDQNAFLVYYTKGFDGFGRSTIESDLPVKQTLQYGARNDAWLAWQEFLDELDYATKHPQEENFDELKELLSKTLLLIDAYVALAPEEDQIVARKQLQ